LSFLDQIQQQHIAWTTIIKVYFSWPSHAVFIVYSPNDTAVSNIRSLFPTTTIYVGKRRLFSS